MPTFRKKPIEVEAYQIKKKKELSYTKMPQWLYDALNKNPGSPGSVYIPNLNPRAIEEPLIVQTIDGPLKVAWDDWIIKGIEGELYTCKPATFAQTYERVPRPPAGEHASPPKPRPKTTIIDNRNT